jgi:hypothetical protein
MRMKLTRAKIRSLGFDWPGSEAVKRYEVRSFLRIDLDATLRALEQGLSFYDGQLSEMRAFQRTWNADWNDVTDHREDYNLRAIELRDAIRKLREIIAAARS